MIFLYLFLITQIIFCNGEEKEKNIFDIRNGVKIKIPEGNMKNIIPVDKTHGFNNLTIIQINRIKNKAKNFVPNPIKDKERIIMKTSHGAMEFELFNTIAPYHCLNFKKLANSGYYDGTLFHKVIPGIIIQGGDILTRDKNPLNDGTGGPGWIINEEFNNTKHELGILSMHRLANDKNSAGSQFFICLSKQEKLDSNYTVFGRVIKNIDILTKISKIPSQSEIALRRLKETMPENAIKEEWDTIKYNSPFKLSNTAGSYWCIYSALLIVIFYYVNPYIN